MSSANMTDAPGPAAAPPSIEPSGKPRRPLSAYNFYFKRQRIQILEDAKVRPEGKPRHSHGKIGFAELARTIANMWKEIGPDEKEHYEGLARDEKLKYKRQMAQWKAKMEHGLDLSMPSPPVPEVTVVVKQQQQQPHQTDNHPSSPKQTLAPEIGKVTPIRPQHTFSAHRAISEEDLRHQQDPYASPTTTQGRSVFHSHPLPPPPPSLEDVSSSFYSRQQNLHHHQPLPSSTIPDDDLLSTTNNNSTTEQLSAEAEQYYQERVRHFCRTERRRISLMMRRQRLQQLRELEERAITQEMDLLDEFKKEEGGTHNTNNNTLEDSNNNPNLADDDDDFFRDVDEAADDISALKNTPSKTNIHTNNNTSNVDGGEEDSKPRPRAELETIASMPPPPPLLDHHVDDTPMADFVANALDVTNHHNSFGCSSDLQLMGDAWGAGPGSALDYNLDEDWEEEDDELAV